MQSEVRAALARAATALSCGQDAEQAAMTEEELDRHFLEAVIQVEATIGPPEQAEPWDLFRNQIRAACQARRLAAPVESDAEGALLQALEAATVPGRRPQEALMAVIEACATLQLLATCRMVRPQGQEGPERR